MAKFGGRDLEQYSRNIRNEKGFRPLIGRGYPKNNEGSDGDIKIHGTNDGVKFFVKYQGEWYSSPLERQFLKEKRTTATRLHNTNGYQILDSGLIIQWGRVGSLTSEGALGTTEAITFPIEFPNECFNVTATPGVHPNDTDGLDFTAGINTDTFSKTGLTFTTKGTYEVVYWKAIGH